MQTKNLNACCMALAAIATLVAAPAVNAQEGEIRSLSQQGVVELTYDHAESGQDVLAVTVEYGLAVRLAEG